MLPVPERVQVCRMFRHAWLQSTSDIDFQFGCFERRGTGEDEATYRGRHFWYGENRVMKGGGPYLFHPPFFPVIYGKGFLVIVL